MKTISVFNYNNKLAGDVFMCITKAPDAAIMASDLPKEIIVRDRETKKEISCSLIDIARFKLHELSSIITLAAEGITSDDFRARYAETEYASCGDIAVYVYKKTFTSKLIQDGIKPYKHNARRNHDIRFRNRSVPGNRWMYKPRPAGSAGNKNNWMNVSLMNSAILQAELKIENNYDI